ncbi:AI-2E family transporter [Halorarum halobium]|uniref:AI-2E family transporter n=1 Tax=Halorarum halobium TaxID=3075121 RepID=UPI0028B12A47|nr:AI-2E family transporter [Halobaculum sp. XH14]
MDGAWEQNRERLAWAAVGLLITGLAAYLARSFVGSIVVGVFLYYATRPVFRRLAARTRRRDVSALVTLLVVGLPLLLVIAYTGLVALREVGQLFQGDQLEAYREMLAPYVNIASLARPDELVGLLGENADLLADSAGAIFIWFVRLFVILTVAFYLLRDGHAAAAWYRRTFGGVDGAVAFAEAVDADLSTVYVGNVLTVAITAVIAAVVFLAFNLVAPPDAGVTPPLLLALLVGVFTLLPVLGIKIVYVPYAGYLLVRSLTGDVVPLWVPVAFFVVTVVVVDTVPDVFIRSYVSKGNVNMGLMLLSYVFGTFAFGWYGLFLGPVVLVLFVHFATRILPNLVETGRKRVFTE